MTDGVVSLSPAVDAVTVLVVDDNDDHRELIRMRLEKLGWVARVAASGEEALGRLDGVDLVLCDYRLPGMDGLQALAAIREQAGPSVVLMTAMGSEGVAVEALRAGAVDYVVKNADYLRSLPRVVERAWRIHDLACRARELQRLALLVSSASGRAEMLGEIVRGARALLRTSTCALYLIHDGELVVESVDGAPLREPMRILEAAHRLVVGGVAPVSSPDSPFRVLALPAADAPLGALALSDDRPLHWSAEELGLAEAFASFAGIALSNLNRLAERTAAFARLALSEQRFRQAFRNAPTGMALLSLEQGTLGAVIESNGALSQLTGLPPERLTGSRLERVVHPADRIADREGLARLVSGQVRAHELQRRYVRSDGEIVSVEGSVSAVCDAGGRPLYAILQVQDVTARKAAEERLHSMALHDTLTGLPNRVVLVDRVEQALHRQRRGGGHVALLFCDLDRFKMVNDSWGHEAGDELLVAVASRLRQVLRPADTAARLGGDEFVLLCEGVTDRAAAIEVAERVLATFAVPFTLSVAEVEVHASIGVCVSQGSESPVELLRHADTAMYRAKARGKARYELYSGALGRLAGKRVAIEQGLRRAVERDELRLVYQPITELRTNGVAGAEALLRWAHPDEGILLPEAFLTVAEESGLIVPIGRWVLHEACRQAAIWQRSGDAPATPVSVNISARQAAAGDLAATVAETLALVGLDARLLRLELTESVLFDAGSAIRREFEQLRAMGVQLGIDDFGTGYASMRYLTEFPIDFLKIDKSFVQAASSGGNDAAIVEAVAQLGVNLGLAVVAEGIETAEQLDWLRALDCGLAQGNYLGRPGPAEDVQARRAASRP